MSLLSNLSLASSSLQVITTKMQVASDNISGARQDGYTKKDAIQGSISLYGSTGSVAIMGYQRATDDALSSALRDSTADAGYKGVVDDYLQQVQDLLGSSAGKTPFLSDAVNKFASAWRQFAAAPESNVQRSSVIQAAKVFADQMGVAARAVEELDRNVVSTISQTLSSFNNDLAAIQDLNKKISVSLSSGQSTGALEDERDRVILRISSVVKVKIFERSNGQIALYTPEGYSLVDGSAASFSYNGSGNVVSDAAPTMSLNNVLAGGKLEALVRFRADSSPAAVSNSPGDEVIRKLRSQLDAMASAFTTSTVGPPQSFANAYAGAATNAGEAASVFVGTDRNTFEVTSTLLNGTATIKRASGGTTVVATLNDSSKTFTADGLSLSNVSYEGLITGIISGFQQAANLAKSSNEYADSQRKSLEIKFSNAVGVNVDSELVSLTTLQSSYAASARVISTINSMLEILERVT